MSTRALLATLMLCLAGACTAKPEASPPPPQSKRSFTATLVRVIDGDSLLVRDRSGKQHELRLAGIDAPERKQAGGHAARRALMSLLGTQTMRVSSGKTDRYKRRIADVRIGSRDISLLLLSAGHAWFYRRFERELAPAQRQAYDSAERSARAQRRGLWRQSDPIPPWEFRRGRR